MLTTLRIKNLALVEDLSVEFCPGFNALTGETGAGKSVIIGGLQLVLGGRADKSLIRSGTDQCVIEALFDVSHMVGEMDDLLQELGLEPCEDNQLLLKRTIQANGSSRQFVNGSPCTVNNLSKIGDQLVDIHGPHDHQSLQENKKQLDILDASGNLQTLKSQLASLTRERNSIVQANAELAINDQEFARQVEILEFQVQEIHGAQLRPDEEETLENAYQRASNATRIHNLCQEAAFYLQNGEPSALHLLHSASKVLHQTTSLDPDADHLADLARQIANLASELASEIDSYVEQIEVDPSQLQSIELRYTNLQSLKKKYGRTVADILAFGREAHEKLMRLQQREQEIENFNTLIENLDSQRMGLASQLSQHRTQIAQPLATAIQSHLNDLGFKQNQFEIQVISNSQISGDRLGAKGFDAVEFMFSPNPGEPLKPLKSIASSGEMARVMLGVKTVLAANDSIPLLVFDEVDANVGGETAAIVGQKLKQIGKNRQTLCITHLAPVAACADAHYIVSKQVLEGRTLSHVRKLDEKSRIQEIARMLGGSDKEILNHAKALLGRKK